MSLLQLPLTHSPPTCIGDDAARLGHKLLAHKVKYRRIPRLYYYIKCVVVLAYSSHFLRASCERARAFNAGE